MRTTWKLLAALLLLPGIPGCSDRVSTTLLTNPQSGRYALSGRVRIAANLADEINQAQGVRRIEDATGVRVRLLRPDGSSDSVLTVDGAFAFRADAPGVYRASCWVVAPDTAAATSVTLAGADVTFPDTLALVSAPDLATYPNPCDAGHGLALEFVPGAAQRAEFEVRSAAGTVVRSDAFDVVAGFTHYHWMCVDQGGLEVPDGIYWVVMRFDAGHRHGAVIKE